MADRGRANSTSSAGSQKSNRNAPRVDRTCSSLLSSPSNSSGARNLASEQGVSPTGRRVAVPGGPRQKDKIMPVRNRTEGASERSADTNLQPCASVSAQCKQSTTPSSNSLSVTGCNIEHNPAIVVETANHSTLASKINSDSESAVSLTASSVTNQPSTISEGVAQLNVKEDSFSNDYSVDDEDSINRIMLASRDLTPLALSHVIWPGFSDPISPSLKNSTSLEFNESTGQTVQKNFSGQSTMQSTPTRTISDSSALHMQNWQASKSNVKERLVYILENELLCDVYFIVGRGEECRRRFAAHKLVLSIGSPVFDAMFNRHPSMGSDSKANKKFSSRDNCAKSEAKSSNKSGSNLGVTGSKVLSNKQATVASDIQTMCSTEIELPDIEPAAFHSLLRFFYTDEVLVDADTVMSCLYVAKKYSVPAMEQACVDFLRQHLCGDNAVMLLAQARLFDEPQLAATCLEMIDRSTAEAVAADGFTEIDKQTLCAILERDTLGIRESRLYAAVCRWAAAECSRQSLEVTIENQRSVLTDVIPLIRFPLMTIEEFASGPAQSGLLNDREVVELFLYFVLNHSTVENAATRISETASRAAGVESGTAGNGFDTTVIGVRQRQLHYSTVPRCCLTGKEQIVSRFCHIENRWGYSGTSDRIRFTVNRNIFVVGFGLYGSVNSPAEYRVNMQIIHSEGGHICGSNNTTFVCDGSQNTTRVFFKEPIEIHANTSYTACATLKGPDSFYGTNGLRKVTHESADCGRVTFQFAYAAGINNGTSVEDGQLPEIIFYT